MMESGDTLTPLTSSQGWGLLSTCPKRPDFRVAKSCVVSAVFAEFCWYEERLLPPPGSCAATWAPGQCCTCLFVTRSFSWAHRSLYALIDLGVGDEGIGGLRERWGRMKGPERRDLVYTDSQIRNCKMQRTLKTKFSP